MNTFRVTYADVGLFLLIAFALGFVFGARAGRGGRR